MARSSWQVWREITMRPVTFLFLLAIPAALAAQEPLSPPLTGPVGDTGSVYSESSTTGPMSSIAPGAGDLTSSYLRTGIQDPLSFAIESGAMSPYVKGGTQSNIEPYAMSGTLNDPLVAQQFRDYRNNSALMSGAGFASRTSAHGVTNSMGKASFAGARETRGTAFGQIAQSSAAGSSLGGAPVEPGQADALASSEGQPGSPEGIEPGTTPSAYADATAGTGAEGESTIATLGGSADSMPIGPNPGATFPILSASSISPTGFADSTMGTAGLPSEGSEPSPSPLLSSIGLESGSPFLALSDGTTSFLRPSLKQSSIRPASGSSSRTLDSIYEATRRQRLEHLIRNPGAPLPSPFEQRREQREYLNRHPDTQTLHATPSINAIR